MRRFLLLVVGVSLLAGVAVASSGGAMQAQPRWVIRDLGTLGGKQSEAYAINDKGQVVGWAETRRGNYHAALWQGGKTRDLGTLGGPSSFASEINNRGEVAGDADTKQERHAFLWQNGKMRDLGTLGGEESHATAINSRGQIVGTSSTARGDDHAFLWENGRMIDLGTLPGQRTSEAVALNERGQVVGTSGSRAFLWQTGRMIDLGVLPGGSRSRAVAINERGQVVAYSWYTVEDPAGEEHFNRDFPKAFVWQNGRRTALGGVPGRPYTVPKDINEQGEVVGESYDKQGRYWFEPTSHAFRWVHGRMLALASDEASVVAISDRGLIVGTDSSPASGLGDAVVWEKGRQIDLGSLHPRPDEASWPAGINVSGTVIGASGLYYDEPRAVIWTPKQGA